MKLEIPYLRKGQLFVCFLYWLVSEKKYQNTIGDTGMADIFYMKDEMFEEYFLEFKQHLHENS